MQFPQIITATPAPELVPMQGPVAIAQETLSGFDAIFDLVLAQGPAETVLTPDVATGAMQASWPVPAIAAPLPLTTEKVAADAPDVAVATAQPIQATQIETRIPQAGLALFSLPIAGGEPSPRTAPPETVSPVQSGDVMPVHADDPNAVAAIEPSVVKPRHEGKPSQSPPVAAAPVPAPPELGTNAAPKVQSDMTKGAATAPAPVPKVPNHVRATGDTPEPQAPTPLFPADGPAEGDDPILLVPTSRAQVTQTVQVLAADNGGAQPLLPRGPVVLRERAEAETESPQPAKMMPLLVKPAMEQRTSVAPLPPEMAPSPDGPGLTPVPDDAPLMPLAQASTAPVMHQPATLGPTVTQQIFQAVQITLQSGQSPEGGRVEISLAPEELGRIQFDLATKGDALRLVVYVERPETLDLIRRHADQLLTDLRNAGFGQTTLDMGGWGQRQQNAPTPAAEAKSITPFSEGLVAQTIHGQSPAPIDGRLHLRL